MEQKCTCGNPEFGFNCACEHSRKHPGDALYHCSICGAYEASEPRCGWCEKVENPQEF